MAQKEEELKKEEEELNYKERVYLNPSFELDYIIFEMLDDRYKKAFEKNMEILKEGFREVNKNKINKGFNNITKIAEEVIEKIKKSDKSVYDKKLMDKDLRNNEDVKIIINNLQELIKFYSKEKVFYDDVKRPGLVDKWKEKMKNKIMLIRVIINDLNIKEKEKEEIKKLLNTLWREIDNKPIKPFSEKFKQN